MEANTAQVDKYKAEIDDLRQQLADTKKTTESVTEELRTRLDSKTKAEAELQEASKQIADLKAKVERDQKTITKLTGAAEEASKVMLDGGKEADQLRETNTELAKKHDAAIAKLQEDLKLLTEEKSIAVKGEQAAKDELEKALENAKAAGTAEKDMKSVQEQLQKAIEEAETHKGNHEKALQEIETLKSDTSSKEVAEKLDEVQQNLTASSATNAALVQQLQEAEAAAKNSETRIQELEAQLKATAAELTDVQSKAKPLSSPTAKAAPGGLEASQWADPSALKNLDTQDAVAGAKEGEEIGSSIEGTVRDPSFILH